MKIPSVNLWSPPINKHKTYVHTTHTHIFRIKLFFKRSSQSSHYLGLYVNPKPTPSSWNYYCFLYGTRLTILELKFKILSLYESLCVNIGKLIFWSSFHGDGQKDCSPGCLCISFRAAAKCPEGSQELHGIQGSCCSSDSVCSSFFQGYCYQCPLWGPAQVFIS